MLRRKVCAHKGMDPKIMMFRCTGCQKLKCGWCEGAADGHPGLCDDCWKETTEAEAAPFPNAEQKRILDSLDSEDEDGP